MNWFHLFTTTRKGLIFQILTTARDILSILSSIYDGVILRKWLKAVNYFRKKSSITDVWQDPNYASNDLNSKSSPNLEKYIFIIKSGVLGKRHLYIIDKWCPLQEI